MKAIIFPGQSSQYAGMGKSLYEDFPQARNIFSSIDNVLGFKLSEKCFEGPESELKDTAFQQLAILAVSLAAFEVFLEKDIKIDYLAGLSLGEYSCLYAAEVLSLEEVVILVKQRAYAMQKAARFSSSTMFAVIGLNRNFLQEKASQLGFYLSNINSPEQIVISLPKESKQDIKKALEGLGAKVIELAVSGGFHSPFMAAAKQPFREAVERLSFSEAKIPIVSNVTAQAHTSASDIKDNLLKQLIWPVLWNDCVDFMIKQGVELFFEIGPSKTLKGLLRKISPETKVINIEKKGDYEF